MIKKKLKEEAKSKSSNQLSINTHTTEEVSNANSTINTENSNYSSQYIPESSLNDPKYDRITSEITTDNYEKSPSSKDL